ncbi:hypothetical protein NKH16_11285 [Mesorhizobium sp. M1307]|uniref:hypothetical protein n=1 Tax=Mesorhizobium sp. M1307 TaxID=2957079 RepID=UPI00333BC3FD
MKRAWGLLSVFLCGCETTDNMELRASNSLNAAYVGRPLSDFIFRNGLNPENMFDMPGGQRVFIFGSPCFSWWHTHRVGTEATPANFIVDRIEIRGYCAT